MLNTNAQSIDKLRAEADRNMLWGTGLINISVLGLALSTMFSKVMYIRNPDMDVQEFFMIRECTTVTLFCLAVNKDLKYRLYDTVSKGDFLALMLRSFFGTGNGYFGVQNVMFFPLVYCGIAMNLAPLVTCILGFIFLKEKMKNIDVFLMLVVFIGVVLISTGSSTTSHVGQSSAITHITESWFSYFGLFFVPTGIAASNIMMRKMNKVHFTTMGIYKYAVLLPVMLLFFTFVRPFNFNLLKTFGFIDWVLVVLAAICQQSSQTFRFLAFKFEKPTRIVHYQYLVMAYSLFFDVFMFNVHFTTLIIIGITVMIFGYGTKFIYQQSAALEDRRNELRNLITISNEVDNEDIQADDFKNDDHFQKVRS